MPSEKPPKAYGNWQPDHLSAKNTSALPADAARKAGLDPHPTLKPSGIDWLGEVPEHWEIKPVKSIATDYEVRYAKKT